MSKGKVAAVRRQELRRSNAAVPIPSGRYKKNRAMVRQQVREDNR